jgi:hypothetical protein
MLCRPHIEEKMAVDAAVLKGTYLLKYDFISSFK